MAYHPVRSSSGQFADATPNFESGGRKVVESVVQLAKRLAIGTLNGINYPRRRIADRMRLAKRLRSHIWSLPVELLIIIAGLLAPRDLRMLTQVSQRLADVAGYLLAIQQGLQITEDGSLVVSPAVFSAILVWRRSAGYRPLNRLHCWFSMNSAEGIRQLNILRAFFFSSPSVMHISLGLWSIEDPVLFADLLDSIRLTRCRKLTFHGSSPKFDNESPILRNMPTSDHPELQTLHADTRMMFTRTFLHYTVNAIVTSPIRDLSLSKTTFSSQQWGHFLPKLNIPHLESLALEAKVPIATLSKFLCRHPHILRLRISGGGDEQRFRPCKTTFQLPRLQSLIGPCAYIGALSQSFTLQHTQLTEIEIHSMSFSIHRLIALLASAAQCQTLCCLILELPGIPLNTSFFADRSQLDFSRVKILAIYCLTRMTAQRVEQVSRWIALFPAIEYLTFQQPECVDRFDLITTFRRLRPSLHHIRLTFGKAKIEHKK